MVTVNKQETLESSHVAVNLDKKFKVVKCIKLLIVLFSLKKARISLMRSDGIQTIFARFIGC